MERGACLPTDLLGASQPSFKHICAHSALDASPDLCIRTDVKKGDGACFIDVGPMLHASLQT